MIRSVWKDVCRFYADIVSLNDHKRLQALVPKVVESVKHTSGLTMTAYPGRIN